VYNATRRLFAVRSKPRPITLDLPPDLERQLREEIPDLDAEVKIAVALDLFRKEQIAIYEFRLMLG